MERVEELETTILINDIQSEEEYKLYTKRWFILALYVSIFCAATIQLQQYVTITETIVKYYDVSIAEVNWSELVYFLEMIVITLPSIFIVEKLRLRKTIIICAIGVMIAAWIKVAGVAPNRFWVIILGQAVNGIFSCVLIIIAPKIAAQWFGDKEVSLACSVGILTTPASLGIGFLIPTSAVNPKNSETFERSLFIVNVIYAAVPTLLVPLLCFCFDDGPPTPPSKTQYFIQNEIIPSQSVNKSIKKFVTSMTFMCLTAIYSINGGLYYAITSLLNPIMIKYYPDSTAAIGYVGGIINLAAIFGTILAGILLDKFRRFKLTAWTFELLFLSSIIVFILLLNKGIYLAFFLAGLYGFSYFAIVVAIVEIGIEVTYPAPEITVFGFFGIGAQACGLCFTYLCTYLMSNFHELTINLILIGILIVGNVPLIFVKYDLKRQAALT